MVKKQLHDTVGSTRGARWFAARRCNPLHIIIFKQNLIRSEGGTAASAAAAEPLSTNFHTNRLDLDQWFSSMVG